MTEIRSRLRTLLCRACCTEVDPSRPVGCCPTCGHTLLASYDLDDLNGEDWLRAVRARVPSLWRYRELLPVQNERAIVTLGEGYSPILDLGGAPEAPGVHLLVKDDGGLPTGSFKARGMAVAVARAREVGVREAYVPSAGNAGVALAAYAARSGMPVRVYLPARTPEPMKNACRRYGAQVVAVEGTIREAGEFARRTEGGRGSFDMSTLREPYRVEGKKTMGLEIFEQRREEGMPDAIVYPTGGGTGLVGMHKAFQELGTLGLLDRMPRLIAVQPEGCAPVVRALRDGAPRTTPWEAPSTVAPGLLVPSPFSSERVLEAVRATGGTGTTVRDAEILGSVSLLARRYGLSASPEGAATYAALPGLFESGAIRAGEQILLYNTGSGLPFLHEAHVEG
ncbi:MAG: threonine synthase [Thermoplasmata archaeon]